MQYHDLRGRTGAYMAGNRKKTVKKVQNTTFWLFFGGGYCKPSKGTRLMCKGSVQIEIKHEKYKFAKRRF